MKRTITLDLEAVSKLSGTGDGYAGCDPLALAANAFSSMARRMLAYHNVAHAEGSNLTGVLHCEMDRCEALAELFGQLKVQDEAPAESDEASS